MRGSSGCGCCNTQGWDTITFNAAISACATDTVAHIVAVCSGSGRYSSQGSEILLVLGFLVGALEWHRGGSGLKGLSAPPHCCIGHRLV